MRETVLPGQLQMPSEMWRSYSKIPEIDITTTMQAISGRFLIVFILFVCSFTARKWRRSNSMGIFFAPAIYFGERDAEQCSRLKQS